MSILTLLLWVLAKYTLVGGKVGKWIVLPTFQRNITSIIRADGGGRMFF
jgi:hypothetical protein